MYFFLAPFFFFLHIAFMAGKKDFIAGKFTPRRQVWQKLILNFAVGLSCQTFSTIIQLSHSYRSQRVSLPSSLSLLKTSPPVDVWQEDLATL